MKPPRYKSFVDKSISAALSSIEIYNKPDFKYREETFSILMINSWELLLKARIIKQHGSVNSIYEFEPQIGKYGNKLKRQKMKTNRSGNPLTITLQRCLQICIQHPIGLSKAIEDNIVLLMEIRDISIHFRHSDLNLCKKILEIGTASLKNYLTLAREWFSVDLSMYNFFLMPISFFHEFETAASFSVSSENEQVTNLLKYIAEKEHETPSCAENSYNISLKLETKFVKSTSIDSLLVAYSKDPNALEITVTEEDALKAFPFDFQILIQKLKNRYSNFKQDQRFHNLKKQIEAMPKMCKIRFLDPTASRGISKKWYSSQVFTEFDKYYTKKE